MSRAAPGSVVMVCTAAAGGMAQVVTTLREAGLFDKFGVRLIVPHDRGSVGLRLKLFVTAFAQFLWLLIASDVKLVHAHVAMRGSFWRKSLFVLLAMLFRKPTLVHLHGSEFVQFYEQECGPLRRAIIRFVLGHASAVIVLSERWRTYIRGQVPRANLVTLHNFIDVDRMRAQLEQIGAARSSDIILFLGAIGKRKGTYDLIRAMPDVVRANPRAKLIIGGTGELEEARQLARDLKMEQHVVFPGWVSGADKTRLLAEAAIYVLPSYNEGLPVSVLEAMAAALPVISTPVGGIPDAIHDGDEGFLIEPGAVADLSRRIVELLNDERLRADMGARALKRTSADFSAGVAVPVIEGLYRRLGAG
jgi:glycosyltransferase involved in cell wall biosynthesis